MKEIKRFALVILVIIVVSLITITVIHTQEPMQYEETITRAVYIHRTADSLTTGTRIRVIKNTNTVIDVEVPEGFYFKGQLLIVGDLYPE